jgi:replicative superfamily II helicase
MKVKSNPAQAEVIKQILKDTNKRIILNYYTGGGKTHIALSIMAVACPEECRIKDLTTYHYTAMKGLDLFNPPGV